MDHDAMRAFVAALPDIDSPISREDMRSFGVSVRASNGLVNWADDAPYGSPARPLTARLLLGATQSELLLIPNFARVSLKEIEPFIVEMHRRFQPPQPLGFTVSDISEICAETRVPWKAVKAVIEAVARRLG
jgi:hypothetical protein